MRTVVRAALYSALLTFAVLCFGVVRKVQIDARSGFARGESLAANAQLSGSDEEWVAAGEAFVASMACYVPFDPVPRRASRRLFEVVDELAARGRVADAKRLLTEAVQRIEADTWLFIPLPDVRTDLRGRLDLVIADAGD